MDETWFQPRLLYDVHDVFYIETAESVVGAEQASEGAGSCGAAAAVGQGVVHLLF